MRINKIIMTALAALVLSSAGLAAADKPKSDKAAFAGTWTVSLGVYQDGSEETELEMEFAFKDKTLVNPMDGSELAWTIDEKAKTISATGAAGTMTLGYKFAAPDAVELSLLKVKKDAKETVIVGDKGTFKLLKLTRKK